MEDRVADGTILMSAAHLVPTARSLKVPPSVSTATASPEGAPETSGKNAVELPSPSPPCAPQVTKSLPTVKAEATTGEDAKAPKAKTRSKSPRTLAPTLAPNVTAVLHQDSKYAYRGIKIDDKVSYKGFVWTVRCSNGGRNKSNPQYRIERIENGVRKSCQPCQNSLTLVEVA